MMTLIRPSGASLIWTLATRADDVRCFTWMDGELWVAAVYFGEDLMQADRLTDLEAVQIYAEAIRLTLIPLGCYPTMDEADLLTEPSSEIH